MRRAVLGLAFFLSFAISAQAHFDKFETTGSGARIIAETDAGKLFKCTAGTVFRFPDPSTGNYGSIAIRNTSNIAHSCVVERTDKATGGTVGGWKILHMPMHGDNITIVDEGDEYAVLGRGQVQPYNLTGQHRTPSFSADGGVYRMHCGDRGAMVRYVADTGSGNVYLPTDNAFTPQNIRDCLFPAGGYRNGFSACVQLVSPSSGQAVYVWAQGTQISRKGEYVVLDRDGEMICLDYDGVEYMITSHYRPSATLNRP